MLLFVIWHNKYAIIEWPLFDAPTSTHGVFTSFSLPQYCCLHFWKNKVGYMFLQGFLRVKGQAQITKCYFLWFDAINMQSLNGHYLMRQQVPIVFLLLLVYLGAIAYISVEIGLGSCCESEILRVKGQASFTNCNFLWLGVICNHQVCFYLLHDFDVEYWIKWNEMKWNAQSLWMGHSFLETQKLVFEEWAWYVLDACSMPIICPDPADLFSSWQMPEYDYQCTMPYCRILLTHLFWYFTYLHAIRHTRFTRSFTFTSF